MSAAEIIAELPRLTAAELAEVQAKLRELELKRDAVASKTLPPRAAHVRTPRLARPEQAQDFVKHVVELGRPSDQSSENL